MVTRVTSAMRVAPRNLSSRAKNKKRNPQGASFLVLSGKTGIRTLGARKDTTVFETVPIDHSGIFPSYGLAVQRYKSFSISQSSYASFLLI